MEKLFFLSITWISGSFSPARESSSSPTMGRSGKAVVNPPTMSLCASRSASVRRAWGAFPAKSDFWGGIRGIYKKLRRKREEPAPQNCALLFCSPLSWYCNFFPQGHGGANLENEVSKWRKSPSFPFPSQKISSKPALSAKSTQADVKQTTSAPKMGFLAMMCRPNTLWPQFVPTAHTKLLAKHPPKPHFFGREPRDDLFFRSPSSFPSRLHDK